MSRNIAPMRLNIEFDSDSDDDSLFDPHSSESEIEDLRFSSDDSELTVPMSEAFDSSSDDEQHEAHMDQHESESDTQEYEIPARREIDLNATVEIIPDAEEDDNDVILIPPEIETINLCTQAIPHPSRFSNPVAQNEVIEITDSPVIDRVRVMRPSPRVGVHRGRLMIPERLPSQPQPGPVRRPRMSIGTLAAPYVSPRRDGAISSAAAAVADAAIGAAAAHLDDSLNATQTPRLRIECPICQENVVNREPVSTTCGHIFCKLCLSTALTTTKNCPMCRKKLTGRSVFHPIYLCS